MEIKRDAIGVVDAINAEDIGKFPDTNLAESLQRISGVSIDRVNGEGSRITARGFGPGFNMVTWNGRAMPTADVVVVGSGGDGDFGTFTTRAFDMSNLASEASRVSMSTRLPALPSPRAASAPRSTSRRCVLWKARRRPRLAPRPCMTRASR
jgi:hypothetical protein